MWIHRYINPTHGTTHTVTRSGTLIRQNVHLWLVWLTWQFDTCIVVCIRITNHYSSVNNISVNFAKNRLFSQWHHNPVLNRVRVSPHSRDFVLGPFLAQKSVKIEAQTTAPRHNCQNNFVNEKHGWTSGLASWHNSFDESIISGWLDLKRTEQKYQIHPVHGCGNKHSFSIFEVGFY